MFCRCWDHLGPRKHVHNHFYKKHPAGSKDVAQIDIKVESRFVKNRALVAAGDRCFKVWGSESEANIYQKSIQN